MSKVCFKCQVEKPFAEFYKHPGTADGYLNKCKSCTRADTSANRSKNIKSVRAYDRARGNRNPPGYLKKYRERFPIKYKAHNMVSNAIRAGKLTPQPCEHCGKKAHAHHDDYSKPLSVRWLCPAHHQQWHAEHGEAANP